MRLENYSERFEEAWKPYWDKWQEHILATCEGFKYSVSLLAGKVIDIPIHSYAAQWTAEKAPEPKLLAEALDRLLRIICFSGEGRPLAWYRKEGERILCDPAIDFPTNPMPRGKVLVVRLPWEIQKQRDFRADDHTLTIFGRFGVLYD